MKSHIDQSYDQPGTLVGLAKQVGINQQKLKVSTRYLTRPFFGYVNAVRTHTVYQLLLDKKLTVNKVAERVSYKNVHQFTAALKRSHSYLPEALKG
ncbi:helix-turn-helix domain-containing protein [Spirosoma pulveris]